MKPKKYSFKTSVHLTDMAYLIWKKLTRARPTGWFSKWVSEELINHYGRNFERKVLTELLVELQAKRDKLEKEIYKVANQIKKIP